MKIKNIQLNSKIIVGPMAGVSNQAFRKIVHRFNPGLIYSEMISDKGILYQNEKTLEMTKVDADEGLVSMQLFGSEVKSMVLAAQFLDQESDCAIIDINMGCPVNKVVTNNGGASLMKDPQLAADIVYAIKQKVNKPVTVKIRTGWDSNSINAVEMATLLEQAGADALAIHGRTRSKMYSGEVNHRIIKQVKDKLSIPVIGNGDIIDGVSAKRMLEDTGVDAIMIARAVWGQPWIVQEIDHYLQGKEYKLALEDRFNITLEHAKELVLLKGESRAIREMRSHGTMAIKGFHNSHHVKKMIGSALTYDEFETILLNYKQQLLQED